MDNSGILPVLMGLAVGISFVVLFAIVFTNHSPIPQNDRQVEPVNGVTLEKEIDPERKAQLESIESELRQRMSELGFSAYGVNLNPLTETIEVVTNDPTKNDAVRALFGKYLSDVRIELVNSDLGVDDFDQSIFDPDVNGSELNDAVYQFAFSS